MTVKRRDFQKAAALIHEFLLKLPEEAECAELRDSLNLSLLHMQRYYRRLRSRMQTLDKQNNGNHLLSQSLRGLSPMTPFRDTPDKFQWKWINLDNPKTASTLPADFSKEFSNLPQIITAAKVGDNNMLMQHIERDPDCIFEVDGLGRNALMYAVNFDHLDTVQILLENGIDVNATAHDGSTAVHRACHNGNHESLQILMEYSADLQIKDVQGRYPIHWACAHKERKCLQLLMGDERNNVDTTVRDNDGMTPSMWACRMDNIEHFELLSSVQVAVEEEDGIERDNNGRTWMHWSVRRTEPLECLKTLLTEDSACMKDEEGKTVMHTAAEMGSLPAVKIVMEIAGKKVLEQRDNQNHTPLILATIGGHGEVVNHLLAEGADLIAVDDTGATAWDYACKRQLHYCMLILASYIRQRAKEEEQGIEAGQGEGYNAVNSMADGTLGLDHLQINGQNGDFPILQGHRPVPPPHPPSEPITPRTPRVPRPKTPHANQERAMLSAESHDKFNSGVKRSPSTPDTNEAESFFEHNHNKPSSANSSKRLKNEHSPDRETLMSVMSVESPDHRSGHSHSATHSPNRSSHSHQDDEPEMANDSQYLDGGDDDQSRVSIDAMDVSDFEADGEDEDVNGVDGSQHHTHHSPPPRHHAHNPAPSPRPPPQPHPRHQQSPTSPPYSYAPSASRSGQQVSPPPYQQSKGSPPLGHQHAGNAYHSQQAMHDLDDDLPPEAYIEAPENGYVEQDDLDPEVTSAHSEDHAHQIHFPTENRLLNEEGEAAFDFNADQSEETKKLLLYGDVEMDKEIGTKSAADADLKKDGNDSHHNTYIKPHKIKENPRKQQAKLDSESSSAVNTWDQYLGSHVQTSKNNCEVDSSDDGPGVCSKLQQVSQHKHHKDEAADTDISQVEANFKQAQQSVTVKHTAWRPQALDIEESGVTKSTKHTSQSAVSDKIPAIHVKGTEEEMNIPHVSLPSSSADKFQAETESSVVGLVSKPIDVNSSMTEAFPTQPLPAVVPFTGQQLKSGVTELRTTPPVETRVIPPAHLSPLPNSMPTVSRKKKKKKKKERSEHLGNDDVPQTRGYIAAIPPPLHQNQPPVSHPPPPGAQRGITPRGGMVGGAGNVRPNSGALKPMPKKRQSTSFTADDDHSFGGQNKSSKLSNQLSGAPSIAPKVPAPRPSSTSMHVPPLPQAQPRPQSSTPSHPKTSDTETLPDNRRILRHPDGGHANYEDADSDDYDERGQGHPGPTKRFQNMKQNGVMANEARGQHQNGPVQWTPSHNRREPSPAPRDMKHPPSPRGRRPPSGSLGSLSQQTHRTKHHLPNGRLPSSY